MISDKAKELAYDGFGATNRPYIEHQYQFDKLNDKDIDTYTKKDFERLIKCLKELQEGFVNKAYSIEKITSDLEEELSKP